MKVNTSLRIVLWVARITGTAMVAITLLFLLGSLWEGMGKSSPGPDRYTILIFFVWSVGLAGLTLAIWKQWNGGLISGIAFLVFNFLALVNPNPDAGYTPILLLFLFPSILYLTYGWMIKRVQHNSDTFELTSTAS